LWIGFKYYAWKVGDCLLQLPPAATWQMLRDKFRECGDVKYAEMRGKDIGLVRFSSDWDAERAVRILQET
jgi:hypothetical protein